VLNSQNGHNIEHLVTTRACKAQTASGDMIPRAPPSMASCALSMAAPLHAQAEAESGLGAKQELRLGAEQEREPGQEHEQGVVAAAAPPPAATAMRSGMGTRPAARGGTYLAVATWGWEETTTAAERAGEGSPGRRAASLDPATHRASATRVEQKTRRGGGRDRSGAARVS
jgi:hypothetical protein